jgi:hypothetical protein
MRAQQRAIGSASMEQLIPGVEGPSHVSSRSPLGLHPSLCWLRDEWYTALPDGEILLFCLTRSTHFASFFIIYGWPRLCCEGEIEISTGAIEKSDVTKILNAARGYFTTMHVTGKTMKRIFALIYRCSLELVNH